jgi:hypothetical protein
MKRACTDLTAYLNPTHVAFIGQAQRRFFSAGWPALSLREAPATAETSGAFAVLSFRLIEVCHRMISRWQSNHEPTRSGRGFAKPQPRPPCRFRVSAAHFVFFRFPLGKS